MITAQHTGPNAEKLRVLGTLAAGVAHDMCNVLNGLHLRLQVLERMPGVAAQTEIHETLASMRQDLDVGIQLLERVRNFARPEDLSRPSFVDLDDVAVEACILAASRTIDGTKIVIERELGSPPPIVGWRGEIVTALLNLVINAVDVTPQGGRVTVRTSTVADGTASVEVEDRGPGISAEVRCHMFEPFYTTKGEGGTGLGLSSVAECVERHGGTMRVAEARDHGATIGMLFP